MLPQNWNETKKVYSITFKFYNSFIKLDLKGKLGHFGNCPIRFYWTVSICWSKYVFKSSLSFLCCTTLLAGLQQKRRELLFSRLQQISQHVEGRLPTLFCKIQFNSWSFLIDIKRRRAERQALLEDFLNI